jgi:hypothetical protein
METGGPNDDIFAVVEADRDHDAETRDDIRRFRSEYGLPADDDVVERFLAEWRAGRPEEGMWLTSEEWERYWRGHEVREEADERLRGYLGAHADSVAGVWFGRGLEPEFNVAFTRDLETHRAALLRLFPRPDVIRVHQARYSEAELDELADRIEEEAEALEALGVTWMGGGTDVTTNRLEVEVLASDAETARRIIEDRYGPAVAVEWLGSDEWMVVPVPWQLWSLDSSALKLTVHYLTGGGRRFHRGEATESDTDVTVELFETAFAGAHTANAVVREATVELERPLGARRVIDGATGRTRERRTS